MSQFKSQVIFVAGGCGTVGSGIVRDLLSLGGIVWVASRNQSSLDELAKSVPNELRQNLRLKQAVVSNEDECIKLREEILEKDKQINHVVSSLGSFWNNGVLSEQPIEEYSKVLADLATSHFIVYKTFSKVLSQQPKSTYTFITGALGEGCESVPTASLVTVAVSALFGIYKAASAEHKNNPNLKINEVRYGMWILNQPDSDFSAAENEKKAGTDWTAKFVRKVMLNHKGGTIAVYNRKQGDELYVQS